MVTMNMDPEAGGNTVTPEDGRDAQGRLPAPLDAALYPDGDGVIANPGQPLGQPASDAGTAVEPTQDSTPPAGMTTANSAALTGATGLAKAKRAAKT